MFLNQIYKYQNTESTKITTIIIITATADGSDVQYTDFIIDSFIVLTFNINNYNGQFRHQSYYYNNHLDNRYIELYIEIYGLQCASTPEY